ncbi:hypothetical protein OEZ86_007709 [Tetradesmus obliquus]|nr:hypothetical protein OEZ86_007709 [Tetradesmus obliquus]
MNYKFANLLGAPYRGGNILFHGNELLSPVGNRVSQVNLAHCTSQTLPFENLNQVRTLCLSPDGQLLLSIDEQGRALLIARTRRVLLHHFSFKGPVTAAAFSPDGKCVAVAVGKLLQVWHSPGFDKQLSPMQLLRTYGTCHDTITAIDWSADGQFIAAASKDLTARVYSLNPIPGWTPPTLAGHKDALRGARLSAADYHRPSGVLVVGFSNGLFELYQLPEFQVLQTLSVSHERISTAAFNAGGDWLALGCAKLGQLLVWEWRSEGYVLRQQGHYFDVSCACYSPDGAIIATGADDSKVKLYQLSSGFCYVTFSEHSAPVSALAFLPTGAAVVSASLDGTVRAFDLLRYRNFRTFTAPSAVQFISLAVENSGEVVAAGSQDDFQIYVWSVKTGRLLDVLAGHEGPVSGLAFCPTQPLLASCSWDKTVRTWDVYDNKSQLEVLQHSHDVLALAWRPDGKQLASATLDGQIYFWNAQDGVIEGVIEGRRDIRGGRLASDRRSAGNLSSGAAFTSLTFSADGSMLFAGGRSKFVCVYDVAEKVLLRRFQVTHNRSLDGVLDQLNSKHMTDAGPLQLIQHEDADSDDELLPAGGDPAAAADVPGTASRKRAVARTRALALSPTGATWAAATTEGLLLYALDAGLNFDPTDLTEALTPQAFHAALAGRAYVRALLIALRLGDPVLLKHGLMSVPPQQVTTAAAQLPALFLQAVLSCVAECLDESPHMEYLLSWVKALLIAHGPALAAAAGGGTALRAALAGGGDAGAAAGAAAGRAGAAGGGANLAATLRALRQVVTRLHKDLSSTAEGNVYLLDYIVSAGQLQQQQRRQAAEQQQQQDEDGGAAAMLVDAAAAVGGPAKTAAAKKAGKKQRKQQKQVLQ